MSRKTCGLCARTLDVETDPLSRDCGGDCWGCIGEIEAADRYAPSVDRVRAEIASGERPAPVA